MFLGRSASNCNDMVLTKESTTVNFDEGIIVLIDKPLTWTSFDVVKRMRNIMCKKLKQKKYKVGHAGTLDPLATGLLIVCLGKATKKISIIQEGIKGYSGTFTLGATTPSYDLETEVDKTFPTEHITVEQIELASVSFEGHMKQLPPIFSALKVDGKRAYKAARRGEEIELAKRDIYIESFKVSGEPPVLDFEVTCTKGTYVRSLAFDFGKALDSGAHLSSLRRERIGDYSVHDAMTLDEFAKFILDADI